MAVDLHVHTIASSDGEFSPLKIVKLAHEYQLQAIAITDHDTIDSVGEAIYFGKEYNVEIIPGCEFSSIYKNRWLHILGYYIDYHNSDLISLCKKGETARANNVDAQIAKLREAGFYLEKEKVLENSSIPLPISFGKAIFLDSRNNSNQLIAKYRQEENGILTFCQEWLIYGRPYNAVQYFPKAEEVIKLILQCGGVPILAHPGASLQEGEDELINGLIKEGLAGIEVFTNWHNENQKKHYQRFCRDTDMIATAGSDFHGKLKPNISLGQIKNNGYDIVELLKSKAIF
ncbi:MAG: hypothetical protein H6Q70_251 [Firmicutes bacterium]|nr:hypothetical protein [Bacillota bacterium]